MRDEKRRIYIETSGTNRTTRRTSPKGNAVTVRRILISALTAALLNSFLVLFSSSASDKPGPDEAARNVLAGCEEQLEAVNGAETFELGLCLGTLKGLHYLSADVCIPPALNLATIAGVLSKYFKSHPTDQGDFRERSLDAMRSAWPCSYRKNI
jgi:hypothetical protein